VCHLGKGSFFPGYVSCLRKSRIHTRLLSREPLLLILYSCRQIMVTSLDTYGQKNLRYISIWSANTSSDPLHQYMIAPFLVQLYSNKKTSQIWVLSLSCFGHESNISHGIVVSTHAMLAVHLSCWLDWISKLVSQLFVDTSLSKTVLSCHIAPIHVCQQVLNVKYLKF